MIGQFLLEFLANYAVFVMLVSLLLLVIRRAWFTLLVMGMALSLSLLVTRGLKSYFGTERPYVANGSEALIQWAPTDAGFPSGHTAVAMTIAVVLLPLDATWGMGFLVVAISIGFSRVLGGVHTPLDIIGGILVGILCAMISWFTVKIISVKRNWQIDI